MLIVNRQRPDEIGVVAQVCVVDDGLRSILIWLQLILVHL